MRRATSGRSRLGLSRTSRGHEVRARVQRPGNPATVKEEFWLAYERVTIRRPSALAVVTDPTDSRRELNHDECAGHGPARDLPLAVVVTLDSLPDLEYKRVVSCKDSFHGTDVLAVSKHGAPGCDGSRDSFSAPGADRTVELSA